MLGLTVKIIKIHELKNDHRDQQCEIFISPLHQEKRGARQGDEHE
jgi:hypothetical protein